MSSHSCAARPGSLLFAVLLLVLTVGPVAAADPPGWSNDVVAPGGVSRAHLPDVELARARDGRLIGVAVRATADESSVGLTILERSAGGAGSWRLLAVTRHADLSPSLAVASGGAVHVAWVRAGSGIRYTTNRTGAWAVEVIPGGTGGETPSVALTNGGTPSVAFSVPVGRSSHAIRIASKTSRGWALCTVATGDVGQPSLRIDQWSRRHIVYVRRSGSAPGLYYATDRSGSWRTYRLASANDVEHPRLVLDRDRGAHVAYVRGSASRSRVLYATNASGTWRTVTVNTAAGGSSPDLALDGSGQPVIAYVAAPPFAAAPVWVASWTGTAWERSAATGDAMAGRPGVAVDGRALHVLTLRPLGDPHGSGELLHATRT